MEVTPWEQAIVLGPCPGCQAWQVDYRPTIFVSYEQCVAVVESVMREHLEECAHLQHLLPEFTVRES